MAIPREAIEAVRKWHLVNPQFKTGIPQIVTKVFLYFILMRVIYSELFQRFVLMLLRFHSVEYGVFQNSRSFETFVVLPLYS